MVGVFRALGNSPLSQEMRVGPQIIVQGQLGGDTRGLTAFSLQLPLNLIIQVLFLFKCGTVVESNTPF